MKLMEKMKKAKKDNKGFSLVELIIVIAIMAILVGIVGTQVIPYLNKSKEAKDLQIINSYSTAAMTAYASNAEEVTENTTVIVYGTNADATGKPAAKLDTEIQSLTYDTATFKPDELFASKAGKTIKAVKIEIKLTDKKIITQAYSTEDCQNGTQVFEAIVSQM